MDEIWASAVADDFRRMAGLPAGSLWGFGIARHLCRMLDAGMKREEAREAMRFQLFGD